MKPVAWAGMRFEVPDDWDIARHAVTVDTGTLAFVDRRHQRLTLSWVPCRAAPDVGRMLADCRTRDEQQKSAHAFAGLAPCPPWRGYRWREGDRALSRAGRHDSVFGRWIEVVFVWPGERDDGLERRILERFSVVEDADELSRVRAFGMDVGAPPGWRLERALVHSGETVLRYRAGRREEAEVRKVKAVDAWFDGDLGGYARRLHGGARVSAAHTRVNGHAAAGVSGPEPRFNIRWLVGGRRVRQDLVWLCPAQNALHGVSVLRARKGQCVPDSFEVVCCAREGEGA